MASGFEESTTRTACPGSLSSCSGNGRNDTGDFECNICFDLAKDPVVTLCGHLFCWPCLCRWLHHHSHSQECPVCKALVQEEKLIPLYGRGKPQTDPRTKSYPGLEVSHCSLNQRPQTPELNPFGNYGFTVVSTPFGGFIPSMLNIQFHPFYHPTVYGTNSGYLFGFNSFHGGVMHGFPQPTGTEQRCEDDVLKNLLLLIGLLVLITVTFGW